MVWGRVVLRGLRPQPDYHRLGLDRPRFFPALCWPAFSGRNGGRGAYTGAPFTSGRSGWGGRRVPNRSGRCSPPSDSLLIVSVGCFSGSASPYGVEDLLGAGLTWTRSLFDSLVSATPNSNMRAQIGTMAVYGTAPCWPASKVSLAYRAPLSGSSTLGAEVRLVISALGHKRPA